MLWISVFAACSSALLLRALVEWWREAAFNRRAAHVPTKITALVSPDPSWDEGLVSEQAPEVAVLRPLGEHPDKLLRRGLRVQLQGSRHQVGDLLVILVDPQGIHQPVWQEEASGRRVRALLNIAIFTMTTIAAATVLIHVAGGLRRSGFF
jgi:hypothetical protein